MAWRALDDKARDSSKKKMWANPARLENETRSNLARVLAKSGYNAASQIEITSRVTF